MNVGGLRNAGPGDEVVIIESSTRALRAYLVHGYTASGVFFAFLSAAEMVKPTPDPRWVFLWLAIAFLIDSTDGPLARAWDVRRFAPRIDGRVLDDIVDYLTYAFIPLVLIWRMSWVVSPASLWVGIAMVASLFGFANTQAKQEDQGTFLGFPSYWNVVAFYVGLWHARYGALVPTIAVVVLAVATVLPLRFVYPNRAPQPWRRLWRVGGVLWLLVLLAVLPGYPRSPGWLIALSAVYPVGYVLASMARELKRNPRP